IQWERRQQILSQQLQDCHQLRQGIHSGEQQLHQIQARLVKLHLEICATKALADTIDQIPTLEQQQHRYQQQLSHVEAARQFAGELHQIITHGQARQAEHQAQVQQAQVSLGEVQRTFPQTSDAFKLVLSALSTSTCLSQQLLDALQAILEDLSEQSPQNLMLQLQHVQQRLQSARQQQTQFLQLERLVAEQTALDQQAKELQASLSDLRMQLIAEPQVQQQQAQLAADLEALNNPLGLKRLYQQELQQQTQLEAHYQAVQQSLSTIQQEITDLDQQLLAFADLSHQVQTQQQQREHCRVAYQSYLEHQQLANSFKNRQAEHTTVIAESKNLEVEFTAVETTCNQLTRAFDPQHFEAVQAAYKEAETQKITLNARLPEVVKRLQDVETQLAHLSMVQVKRDRAQTELVERQNVKHLITFARKAYKQAGPHITERYVQNISREADKLFRELLNRQDVALSWTREYEILVQEGSHARRFVNLSGGEQMCAALAVRLALLKVLADIDIAFFDEPTTNMDQARRAQLAEAIAHIKSFRQLFVISHDDTFEKVTGNVVLVERSSGSAD
ncbi:MAG TPA: hypothetical protein V6D03_12785, partial [Candidatus Caenarcaniphilales bacterium]